MGIKIVDFGFWKIFCLGIVEQVGVAAGYGLEHILRFPNQHNKGLIRGCLKQ